MNSTNQSCNALQSLVSVFLHSCGVPDTVCELLAHMGLSISTMMINHAINNLSWEAENQICETGQTLLTSYAFDNLDMDLKHIMLTIENSQDSLIHLTSVTMLPLDDEVTLVDLDCAESVWKTISSNIDMD